MIHADMSRPVLEWIGKQHATNANPARILGTFDLAVDPRDKSLCQHLMQDGYWESWTTAWFTKVIKPGMFCVDVGANFGYVTGLMAELTGPDGEVWAFEPAYTASLCLRQSQGMNKWHTVHVISKALGEEEGTLTLHVADEYAGGSSFVMERPYGINEETLVQKFDVPVIPFDSLTLPRPPDIIKIDVEGFEPQVLRGMKETLKHNPLITMELLPPTLNALYPWFLDYVFDTWAVYNIEPDGGERRISRDEVEQENWWMVVLREA